MKKQISRIGKSAVTLLLVALLVTGMFPVQSISNAFDTTLAASASTYKSGTVSLSNLSAGDIVYSGVTIKNNTSYTAKFNSSTTVLAGRSKTMSSNVKITSKTTKYDNSFAYVYLNYSTVYIISSLTLSPTSVSYTGSTRYVSVSKVTTTSGSTVSSSNYTVSGTRSATNVNTYTVKVTGTGSYIGSASASWKITPVNASVTKAPTGKSLTYNGSAQELIVPGTASGGTMQYKGGSNASYSSAIPKGTNAGTYTINYQVVGDSNHNTINGGSVTATISKAPITPRVSVSDVTYPSQVSPSIVSGTNPGNGTVTYSYSTSANGTYVAAKPTDAGNYYVKATVAETANYMSGTSEPVPFTINKADIIPTVNVSDVTYPDQVNPTVSGNTGNGTVTFLYSDSADGTYTTTKPTSAGTYYVKATVGAMTNYNGATTAPKAFTINKANITPTVNVSDVTYPDQVNPTVSGNTGNGTVTFLYSDSADGTYTTTKPTNAGTYYVKATVGAMTNYNGATTAPKAFTINRANITPTVNVSDVTYPNQVNPSVSGNTGNGTVTYSYSNSADGTYTATKPTNAGTYYVKATVGVTTNYYGATTAPKAFTIKKADITPTIKISDVTYPSKPNPSVDGNSGNGAVTYYYSTAEANGFSSTVPTSVGKYYVYATVGESTNYNSGKTDTKSFTISYAAPTYKEPTPIDSTYDGSAHALISLGTATNGTMKYSLTDDESKYSTTIPTGTDAGTYTIYYKIYGDANYSNLGPFTVTATIGETDPKVTAPTGNVSDYNGKPQPLVTAGSAIGGTMQYSLDGTNYSADIPTKVDAGNYQVYYKVVGDKNHKDTAPQIVTAAISKIDPTVTDPKAKSLVYNENPQELIEAGSTTGGTMLYSTDGENYSTDIPTKTDADTYPVYYKVDGGNNYNDVPAKQLNVTIQKADPEVPAPTPNTLTYDGTDQELITPTPTDDGTVLYSLDGENFSEEIPTGKDADKYTVYYKLDGDDNHNDAPVDSVTVVINKANPTITPPEGLTLTYNGKKQGLITEGTTNVGTMLYSLDEDGEFSEEIPERVQAGTYEVYYKVDCNDDNYNDVPAASVTAVINKITPKVTPPTGKEWVYDGSYHVLADEGSTTGGTLVYSLTNNDGDYNSDLSSFFLKRKDVGVYTIYYKVIGEGLYGDVPVDSVTATISKAEPSVTAPTALDLTYNGKDQVLVNAGTVPKGCTILYSLDDENYSEELPKAMEVGSYSVYYKVNGGNNYFDVDTQVVEVKIKRADPVVTPPKALDLTYTGEDQELITPAETTGGTVYYILDDGDLTTEIPKAKDVGEYTVTYLVKGDKNYNNVEPKSITVTINPKAQGNLTVKFNSNGGTSVDDQTVKYNSTASEPNDPFRSGYTFLGWYYNGQLYNFSTAVKEDIVLEAKWKSTNELIKGNSATFNEALDFNFFAKISKDSLDGAYVLFKYEHYGIPKELKVMADPNNMRGSYYRFACPLMSSELTVDVTAELYVNGSTEPVSTWTRNVRNFCIAGMNDPNTPEEEKNVLRATLNYGGYSQERFNQNTNLVIANKDYEDSVENVTVKSTITQNRPYESVKGLEYVGSSVFLVNVPYLRYYFRIVDDSASISDFTFTVNGTEYVPTLDSSGYYYFETAPVYAFLLDQPQRVIVKKGNAKVFDFNNSIIKWAETAASEENGKDQNIAKALFVYYEAAKAFAEYKSNGGE